MGGKGGGKGKKGNTDKLYRLLDVDKSSTSSEITQAYRRLAVKHHPDKGGDPEKFKEINAAYEVLKDSDKREKYDKVGEGRSAHPVTRRCPKTARSSYSKSSFGGRMKGERPEVEDKTGAAVRLFHGLAEIMRKEEKGKEFVPEQQTEGSEKAAEHSVLPESAERLGAAEEKDPGLAEGSVSDKDSVLSAADTSLSESQLLQAEVEKTDELVKSQESSQRINDVSVHQEIFTELPLSQAADTLEVPWWRWLARECCCSRK
eukprot:Skav217667  [mRNA]  locus=scaffold2919:179368:180147:+ [translate_table: standard]